ncbi:MAG TPA: DEAD/DEAH box helicase [Thermodesulfatator atlanticus]|uniref:DEAD/DEAH box helicase n=1 Tax=Thermodesulfatator atlanticus TaxID=501497 RepID=A0A7V5U2U3_9BACT|nr:DEAD/DEAH box helicase [Thermodesulfatator atlanticus]
MLEVAKNKEVKPLLVALHGRPFSSFPLHPSLLKRLEELGFTKTTIIQDLFLPQALKGHDVIVKARRGSGKALAYLITIFDRFWREPPSTTEALVLVTSEARAQELASLAQHLSQGFPFSVTPFAAEEKIPEEQLKALEKGSALLITTPHWLNRIFKWRLLRPETLKIIVLDEFDQLVAQSRSFVENLLKKLPPPGKRQGLVFMEELNYETLEMAYQFLKDPDEIYVELGRQDFSAVNLALFHVSAEEKFMLLLGVLEKYAWPKTIVFVNNKVEAQSLCDELKKLGARAVFLKPDLGPEYRLRFLKQFAGKEADILVATDAGCRFIQQKGVSLVINYDLPETAEDFRQRALKVKDGGEIISFCDEEGAFYLEFIEKELGFKLPVKWPEPEEEWFLSPVAVKEKLAAKGPSRTPAKRPKATKKVAPRGLKFSSTKKRPLRKP